MERYLITGASRGIGRAIAVKLAAPGRQLLLHGRDDTALGESCRLVREAGGEAVAIQAELSRVDGIEELIDQVGKDPLQALVNNAGVAYVKPVEEVSLGEWLKTFMVNVTAPFLLCQRLMPFMPAGAGIVNIMSIAARVGFPNWSSYAMAKFALEGFSQSLREEVRPRGIRVINIYPSATSTDLWDTIDGDWPRDKMTDPSEVAKAVAFALERPAGVLVDTITIGNIAGTL